MNKRQAAGYTTFLEFDLTVLDIIVRVHAGDIYVCMRKVHGALGTACLRR